MTKIKDDIAHYNKELFHKQPSSGVQVHFVRLQRSACQHENLKCLKTVSPTWYKNKTKEKIRALPILLFHVKSKWICQKTKIKVSKLNETRDGDLRLWFLADNAALREKKIVNNLRSGYVSTGVHGEKISLIVSAVGGSSLPAIQVCTTAKESWGRFQLRYAEKPSTIQVGVLESLLNLMFRGEIQLGDDNASIEIKFSRLISTIDPVRKSMHVAMSVL